MTDWEGSYAGVVFGRSVGLRITQLDGWADLPDMRSGDQYRPMRHGLYAGADLLGGRTITLTLMVGGTGTASGAYALYSAFEAATVVQSAEAALIFQMPGRGAEQVMARPRRRAHTIDVNATIGIDYLTIEFVATDPRIYSTTLQSLSTASSTITGGLAFNAVAPFVFGTAGTGGGISATNAGSIEAPYTLTFTGPLSAPQFACAAQAKTLTITNALAAGETLVLNSDNKTVLLNGTASRYSWLGPLSQWPQILPGSNSFQFSDALTGTAALSFRSARA